MIDYVLDMIANVLTSQKWCEPTSYRWNTFHESCLNESTHLKDWGPCGRFSFCQLGGIEQSPTIHIRVQETFGINVTFLYFEMLLNHNRRGSSTRHLHGRRSVEEKACHPPYMQIRPDDDIVVERHNRYNQIMVCGKRDLWSELMYENIMILTFEFDTYLKHSVTVMLIYETLDKRDYWKLRLLHRFSNLGRHLKPLNVKPYAMWPHNDNSVPYLFRFKLHLPITVRIVLKYISG